VFMAQNTVCDWSDPTESFAHFDHFDSEGYPVYSWFDPSPVDAWYKLSGLGVPQIASTNPMGAVVSDLDGDLDLDLVVATAQARLTVFGGETSYPLEDVTELTALIHPIVPGSTSPGGGEELPWGTALLDLDQDGRAEILTVHGDDFSAWSRQDLRPQHMQVFWNGGAWRFADVTDITGLAGPGNYRTLSVGDLEGDGDADLIVGGIGELPRVFRNDIVNGNHGLALELQGTTSNPLGFGATVVVRSASTEPRMEVVGGIAAPHVAATPILFAGLGSDLVAESVEITWPSGTVQIVEELAAGEVHVIHEPPVITLSEPSRHLPADGVSALVVTVTPRAPDGTVSTGHVVSIEARFGHDGWEGPAVMVGDAWQRTLVAPTVGQTTVVEVTIDGALVRVRPRVWWD